MPLFRTPYKNVEDSEPLSGRALRQEIAARTLVKESVVDLILDTFKEVATEEIVNKGSFSFSGLFSVKNFDTKETVTPKGVIPARKRLSIRLNDRVKKLWNFRFKHGITEPKAFEEMLEDFNQLKAPEERQQGPLNPMLEDDDDEY